MLRALVLLVVPATAFAVPTTISHQGRLVDSLGAPLQGSLTADFEIYDAATLGDDVWSQLGGSVQFEDGYFSVLLTGVDSEDLTGPRWLALTIDGTTLPRQAITSVPFSLRSAGVTLTDVDQTCDASTTALHGTIRFRNDTFEGCSTDGWNALGAGSVYALGGSVVETGGYRIHTFTSSGTLSSTGGDGAIEVMVVAGGGGGGGRSGGGGGAGGLVYDTSYDIIGGEVITVTIGSGGSGGASSGTIGQNGQNSVFGTLTAIGGGGGGSDTGGPSGQVGIAGGSGGGGQYSGVGGAATSGQGNVGGSGTNGPEYNSGGGGGAGEAGKNGTTSVIGDGGDGLSYDISGTATFYAGGGGGGTHITCPDNISVGGQGGGGGGGLCGGDNNGSSASNGTGGGGGGAASDGGPGGSGGNGGSGIVIVRYPL